jgi:hypothetical protein
MKKLALLTVGVFLLACALDAQGKPVLVVTPFTSAPGVEIPYDLSQLQAQLIPELKVMLGKDFEIVSARPVAPGGTVYLLEGRITGWRPGNAAKRLMVGMGSGREATDLEYEVTDPSSAKVVNRRDTIRTNFYAQNASTGTLAHPIAQKISEYVKKASLR